MFVYLDAKCMTSMCCTWECLSHPYFKKKGKKACAFTSMVLCISIMHNDIAITSLLGQCLKLSKYITRNAVNREFYQVPLCVKTFYKYCMNNINCLLWHPSYVFLWQAGTSGAASLCLPWAHRCTGNGVTMQHHNPWPVCSSQHRGELL